jgi:hypothetical protein
MANPIFILDIGPDGVVATHPARVELPVFVKPIPEEKKTTDFNTIRAQLITLGCMQLPGRGFEFDSSFISPTAEQRFAKFAKLMQALRDQDNSDPKRFPPVSVFGHADPTGADEYNKHLSGRRARAVYGLLTRKRAIWHELYDNSFGGDSWGVRSVRVMLSTPLQQGELPFYTGPAEPGPSPADQKAVRNQTHDAVLAYQKSRHLGESGVPDHGTRDKLFEEYMNAICHDGDGKAFQLTAETDFLARHKDGAGLKGDVQGCGDFNEIFLLSKEQEDLAKHDKVLEEVRNEVYRKDRRVLVFIFEHGTEIDFNKWPCPRVLEGSAGCTIRFWSDYKDRRKRTSNQRTFGRDMDLFVRDEAGKLVLDDQGNPNARLVEETGNTMACRWYHAFAVHSPCERKMEEWIVRIKVDSGAAEPQPLVGRRWVAIAGEEESSPVIRGTTDERGEIRIPVLDERAVVTLKLDAWGKRFKLDDSDSAQSDTTDKPPAAGGDVDPNKFPDEDKFLTFRLAAGALRQMVATDDELPAKQRLYNLGFGQNAPEQWTDDEFKDAVRQYRKFKGLGKDANLDGATRIALENDHELSDLGPQPDETDGGGGDGSPATGGGDSGQATGGGDNGQSTQTADTADGSQNGASSDGGQSGDNADAGQAAADSSDDGQTAAAGDNAQSIGSGDAGQSTGGGDASSTDSGDSSRA